MLNFLLFAFELSSEKGQDNQQYLNKIKNRIEIKALISEEFMLKNLIYKLKGIICYPTINHYSYYFFL